MPAAVGVPLIVMVFEAQEAVTPAGRPVGVPIPVANVVVCVIAVSAVLMQRVGAEEAADAVLASYTVIVPVAFTVLEKATFCTCPPPWSLCALLQPPVSGMV